MKTAAEILGHIRSYACQQVKEDIGRPSTCHTTPEQRDKVHTELHVPSQLLLCRNILNGIVTGEGTPKRQKYERDGVKVGLYHGHDNVCLLVSIPDLDVWEVWVEPKYGTNVVQLPLDYKIDKVLERATDANNKRIADALKDAPNES